MNSTVGSERWTREVGTGCKASGWACRVCLARFGQAGFIGGDGVRSSIKLGFPWGRLAIFSQSKDRHSLVFMDDKRAWAKMACPTDTNPAGIGPLLPDQQW